MSPAPLIHGEGTTESRWREHGTVFAPASLTGCSRLVVVAPHPDDEVLGVGGLVAMAAASGVDVVVVAVTDGESSHPGSPTLSPEQMARARALEREAALADLGVGTRPRRVGVPDGGVAGHEDRVGAVVAEVVAQTSRQDRGSTWVAATWQGDGHPDHEASGRAAAAACAATGARLLEYPVWTWHWAVPQDARVPWDRARSVALPPAALAAKHAAVARFVTQVAPLSPDPLDAAVLPPGTLARLLRPHETLFV